MMTTTTSRLVQIDTLKRDHPIADVLAASGVKLHPGGPGTFKACCPFHDDRIPSMLVDTRDDHFHCFSCQAHGDTINFVMRRDNISFGMACARIAALPTGQAHVTTHPSPSLRDAAATTTTASHEDRISRQQHRRGRRWGELTVEEQTAMNIATRVWQDALWRNDRALAYLHRRGITNAVIHACGIGYADGLTLEAGLARHLDLRVAVDLGLLRPAPDDPGGTRPYRDCFAGRIVIPEMRGGNTIWCIGRALDDRQPKYLAMGGERPVLGFERTAFQRDVLLVEGVFDFLSAVSWDLPVCSPCGTSMPAERLGFLAQAEAVYGVLDADAAGRAATEVFGAQLGDRWRPIRLPDGLDLNDLALLPGGKEKFFELLSAARWSGRKEALRGA